MGKHSALIDALDSAIDLDRINSARTALAKLDDVAQEDEEVKAYFQRNARRIERLRASIDYLDELLVELRSEAGWTVSSEQRDGTTTYFKHEEDSAVYKSKIEALLPCEPAELPRMFTMLMALFNEADLMPRWYPMGVMKSHQVLLSPSVFSKATHLKFKLPFPINRTIGPRDCVISTQGFEMPESRSAAITIAPLEVGSDFHNLHIPGPERGYTRCSMRGIVLFEAREDGLGLKHMLAVDLNASAIPSSLKHWFSKGDLMSRMISRIRVRLAKFEGSDWESRIMKDTILYRDVEDRLAELVLSEFGVEPVRFRQGSTGSTKRSVIRKFSLRRRKKKQGEDEHSEDGTDSLDEGIEESVELDSNNALFDSIWKVGMEMLESCGAAIGARG